MMIDIDTTLGDRYEMKGIVGQGGMSQVVRAYDRVEERPVAIKFLLNPSGARQRSSARFLREARTMLTLRDSHNCRAYGVGLTADDSLYIIMEWLDGMDLAAMIESLEERGEPFDAGRSVDLVLQAAGALCESHSLGIVHRDIKPSNLFITTAPNGAERLVVLDYGVAKSGGSTDSKITREGELLGTPAYMAPEQITSSQGVDARSDIWSLGLVLYRLLAGFQPLTGATHYETLVNVHHRAIPALPSSVPSGLAHVVRTCLRREPSQRYQSMDDFMAALAPSAADRLAATRLVHTARARSLGVVQEIINDVTTRRMVQP